MTGFILATDFITKNRILINIDEIHSVSYRTYEDKDCTVITFTNNHLDELVEEPVGYFTAKLPKVYN